MFEVLRSVSATVPQIKTHLRQQFRQQRDRLDTVELSQQLSQRLSTWPELQRSRTILAYWPHNSELSLLALMELWHAKIWGLPRCLPGKQLAWHAYAPQRDRERLVSGKFGILEPPPTFPLVDLVTVDAVLVPALACDRWGTRLGYGGGYYDRCLARSELQQCLTVGIVTGSGFSQIPLPRDDWDVSLQAIATPQQIMRTRTRDAGVAT